MEHFRADDGESVYVEIMGEGSPVVFLHGWTSSAMEWLYYAKAISDRHRVFCWNARGHGGHVPSTESEPTVQRMAKDVRDLIDHYELESPALVGHSMGALTIWEYVLQFGCDRLSKLCIIDQSPKLVTDETWQLGIYGGFTETQDRDFVTRLEDDFPETVLKLAAYGKNPKSAEEYQADQGVFPKWRELLRRVHPGPLISCWKSLSRADYRGVLPKIHIPTLLIYGDESQFYSLETAEYVRENIPGAVLHVYEGTDHAPHLWERQRFVSALGEFLADDHHWAGNGERGREPLAPTGVTPSRSAEGARGSSALRGHGPFGPPFETVERCLDTEFWHRRWSAGEIAFHQGRVNPHLERFWTQFAPLQGTPVFVPLCGKSLDMAWLAARGHPVRGVEISAIAVQAFFAESGLVPQCVAEHPFTVYRSPGFELLCGDFFALAPSHLAMVGAVYDRASLIAFPRSLRTRYAEHLSRIVPPAAPVLLVTLEYAEEEMQGPPFTVTEEEVHALYGDVYGIELLYDQDALAEAARFREKGLTALREKVYRLTAR